MPSDKTKLPWPAWQCALLGAFALVALPTGNATASPGKLAPHRAVYDLRLDNAGTGSGVSELSGLMVFEITGSPCEGYTQNMRLVTEIVDRKGRVSHSDLRSSSWEQADGRRFRFNSSTFRGNEKPELAGGDALRAPGDAGVSVHLKQPKQITIGLPGGILFPIQHSQKLLEIARSGERILQADIYDGSELGRKFYNSTAIIGNEMAAGSDDGLAPVENTEPLANMRSWPVAISYFEPADITTDGLPSYEMAFRYYDNGVTRKLKIDYGDFSIRGALKEIKFFANTDCKAQ